jgi:beta-1,4-mannosyltransferase
MNNKLTAYFYPFEHDNKFIERNQNALRNVGFRICRVTQLLSLNAWSNRDKNITVLNWVEDQKYRRSNSFLKAYILFFGFLGLILLSKIMSNKVVWIKHNLKPHNAHGNAVCHRLTCVWFNLLNIKAVGLEEYYGARTLKHPLYFADAEIIKNMTSSTPNKVPTVFFFGAIKSYKKLHIALAYWPISLPLRIRGKAQSASYEQQLRHIIESRRLKVDWKNEFISDEALNIHLKNSDFVLLPHSDNAMISSGSYYHGLSLGCNIICFSSVFAKHKAEQFPFTHIFDPKTFSIGWLQSKKIPREEVLRIGLKHHGERQLVNSWKTILSIK